MLPCKSEKCRAAIGQSGHSGRAVADSEAMEGLLFWVRDQVDLRLQGRIHPVSLPARQPASLLSPCLFNCLFVCLFVMLAPIFVAQSQVHCPVTAFLLYNRH